MRLLPSLPAIALNASIAVCLMRTQPDFGNRRPCFDQFDSSCRGVTQSLG